MSAKYSRPGRTARKAPVARPLGDFVRLEDRCVPNATLVDVARGLQAAGVGDGDVLAATPDGRYAIFSSEATDLVIAQVDVPGTRDLFWIDTLTNSTKLVTASPLIDQLDKTQYSYSFGTTAFGYSFNEVEPFSQAVISDDGKYVGFTSKVNAGLLDADYATSVQIPALVGVANKTVSRDRGDASYDLFRWNSDSGTIQLGSRTYDNAGTNLTQAFGNKADVINPAISGDGSKLAFLSARNAADVYDQTSNYMIDSSTPTDDVFLVDFERITAGDAQNTTVVSQITNPYLNSTFFDEPGYFWTQDAATFGFIGQYAPVVDTLFYFLITITNPDGSTTTQFTGNPIDSTYSSNVTVDPHGRYLSADGGNVAYTSNINALWLNNLSNTLLTDLNYSGRYDAFRSTVVDVGQGQPAHIVVSEDTPATATTSRTTIASGGGTVDNIIISRDTGDRVLFPARVNGVTIADATVASGAMHLYFRPVTTDGPLDAVLVTSTFVSSSTVGLTDGGLKANTDPALDAAVVDPESYALSNDGKFVAFANSANGVTEISNTKGFFQVYRRDTTVTTPAQIAANKTSQSALRYVQMASVAAGTALAAGNGNSLTPSISSDGRFVAFQTDATTLIVGGATIDLNGAADVALRDYAPTGDGSTTAQGKPIPRSFILSLNADRSGTGNGASTAPIVTNGKSFFTSTSSDLVVGIAVPEGSRHVYRLNVPPEALFAGSPDVVAVGGGFTANAALVTFSGSGEFVFGSKFTPFPGFTGEVRVASGDLNGDGVVDLITGSGAGGGPRVVVFDGATGARIVDFFAFESGFRGGVTVAFANFGTPAVGTTAATTFPALLVGADEGGGSRIQVYQVNATSLVPVRRANFFAYEATFRGGVRIAAADVTGDGIADVIAGAGMGGGPRVSVFDGTALNAAFTNAAELSSTPARPIDYFAFEATLRNGVYVGGGDLDGDGFAEVVVGGGPGGGPRVTAFDGRTLTNTGLTTQVLNFFAFPNNSRDGVRVAVRNVDGLGLADIVVGQGAGQQSRIKAFSGDTVDTEGTPQLLDDVILFDDFSSLNGAWVG